MSKVFSELIGKSVEVYVDGILVKTGRSKNLIGDLKTVFTSFRQHNMRLNPLKCAFAMEARKFLGFMITQRGVDANPEKCEAILQMTSPRCVKDTQRLTPSCEEAFNLFKSILSPPPVLGKPRDGETLFLYLAVTDEALAAVLVRVEGKTQQPFYFVSKALQGTELRYSKLEKLAYALLTSSRRLRQYFQGHQVIVRTDQATCQVLQKSDLTGRMMTWAIELSQYDLQYEPRHSIKAQAMADFLVEVTGNPHETPGTRWKLHVDGASNQTSGRAGIILESPTGIVYEQSVKFDFPVSNNQVEYETLIGGLLLSKEVGVIRVEVNSDSQVVTSQINGTYPAKDPLLQKYLEKFWDLRKNFEQVLVQHIPRVRNTRADLLSKLASTKPRTGNCSLIQGLVKELTVALCVTREDVIPSWVDPIADFLESRKLPDDDKAVKALRREAAKYIIIQGQLYKRGLNQPLLKCLRPDQMDYMLREVHEGCCGHHIGERLWPGSS
nr:uncharacterized protein LOC112775317 [Arachis hypogaea]